MSRIMKPLGSLAVATLALSFAGCTSVKDKVYYGTLEEFGVHKRDVLVSRVDAARESQQEAKQEFQDALQVFMSVIDVEGGQLEEVYDRMRGQLDDAEGAADKVSGRIRAVEGVARALFEEWERELDQYADQRLRRESQQQLNRTQRQYEDLLATMHSAEERMQPVLQAFSDRVLFLKHNLNAMAISSLRGEAINVRRDVEALIREMERAIAEAEDFIAQMRNEGFQE